MIIDLVSSWVGSWWVGRYVVGGRLVTGFGGPWIYQKPGKNMFGVKISLCTLIEVYFVVLILFFSKMTIKKKQIWLPEAVTRIFYY